MRWPVKVLLGALLCGLLGSALYVQSLRLRLRDLAAVAQIHERDLLAAEGVAIAEHVNSTALALALASLPLTLQARIAKAVHAKPTATITGTAEQQVATQPDNQCLLAVGDTLAIDFTLVPMRSEHGVDGAVGHARVIDKTTKRLLLDQPLDIHWRTTEVSAYTSDLWLYGPVVGVDLQGIIYGATIVSPALNLLGFELRGVGQATLGLPMLLRTGYTASVTIGLVGSF
jgi:hypothetical protein